MTWHVDVSPQSAHIALHGSADAASLAVVQHLLSDMCGWRGGCLTIDLSGMSAADHAFTVGSALPAGYDTVMCGSAVLLGLEPPPATAASRTGPGLRAQLGENLAGARQALTRMPQTGAPVTELLLPASGAAGRCRDVVRSACLAWGLEHLTQQAALIAGELVNDTIERVSTLMTFAVMVHEDDVYLWVRGGRAPTPEPLPEQAEASLGLLLIHSLADRWGFLQDGDDTLAWAALPTHAPR